MDGEGNPLEGFEIVIVHSAAEKMSKGFSQRVRSLPNHAKALHDVLEANSRCPHIRIRHKILNCLDNGGIGDSRREVRLVRFLRTWPSIAAWEAIHNRSLGESR